MYCKKPMYYHLWRILHTIRLATDTNIVTIKFIVINLLVRPRVEIGLGRREVFDNEEISFQCVGDGYPSPSVQVHTSNTITNNNLVCLIVDV